MEIIHAKKISTHGGSIRIYVKKGKNIKISFDDWIFKQDEEIAINRATLKKFGFKVGELTVFFKKINN